VGKGPGGKTRLSVSGKGVKISIKKQKTKRRGIGEKGLRKHDSKAASQKNREGTNESKEKP